MPNDQSKQEDRHSPAEDRQRAKIQRAKGSERPDAHDVVVFVE